MATFPESFWPNDILPTSKVFPPLTILQQAAGQLPEKTNNLFEAKISTETEHEHDEICLVHTLYVVVPALERYARPLLNVSHGEDDVYPAWLFDFESSRLRCNTQDDLMTAIHETLSSSRVKSIFYSLAAKLSQLSVAS